MQSLSGSIAALAVASIYCIWRVYFQTQLQRQRALRQRVACLLWTLAQQAE